MKLGKAFLAAALLAASTSRAESQARATPPVVIPKTVLRSMVASKPKSKKPLGARLGILPRKNVGAARSVTGAPTSVKSAPILSGKH